MTNIEVLENKISAVKKYLKILTNFSNYSKEKIISDLTIRGSLERYLYLAVQATIDLAEATVSYKKLRKPATLSESFYILKEEKIISDVILNKMVKMVGFRNIMAHDYEEINYDIVFDVLHNHLKDLKEFLKAIDKAI